ncbi:hypothetical protein Rhe02_85570 [Rhizocola hellebori]|uniref:Uncharacterized protein n=2 Tax=Rhizocola hellebori TaxID=1392758 RepID=A0A8J3QIU5_9ACTN|nr:hypothetical protein Rhe02_85570 [Rhizocola hellebori]
MAVVAALLIMLLYTDTAVTDIARYAAYVVGCLTLPGMLIYRALRGTPHTFAEDAAVGTAVGLVLEIPMFALASMTELSWLRWAGAAAIVVAFVATPGLRRHLRPGGYQRVPILWSWAVAAVTIYFLGYLTAVFLQPNQPLPHGRSQLYLIDELYFLSLVGEAKHHFPLTTPAVAGESLPYHWFSFAHMANASLISGVDTTTVMFRLALPVIAVLCVVLLAVVGWRVSGRAWVGAVAAGLTFAVGQLTIGVNGNVPGDVMVYFSWTSLSVLYGTAMTLPLIMAVADRLGGNAKQLPLGKAGAWVLLAGFALASPGAKSTIVPVVLGGVALVFLVQLVRRRLTRTTWLVIAALVGAQLVALVAIYHFQAQSLQLGPIDILRNYLVSSTERPWWKQAGIAGLMVIGYLISIQLRLIGIPILLVLRKFRPWTDVEWMLLGGLASGTAAILLLWHTSWSQYFFMCTAFPFGAILSATGLVALVEQRRLSQRTVIAISVYAVLVAMALGFGLPKLFAPIHVSETAYKQMLPVFQAAVVVFAVAGLTALAIWLASRRHGWLKGAAAVAALSVIATAGLSRMMWDARKYANAGTTFHIEVSPERATAARWLRDHSDPDDVVATNAHRVTPEAVPGWSLSYWMSALTERRFLVESWGYTPTATRIAGERHQYGPPGDFWDPDLLARNDAAIMQTTAEGISWLREQDVKWVMVDRRFGTESAVLARYATLQWSSADIMIYELKG